MAALVWNWYEIYEAVAVSLAFVLVPLLIHAETRHRQREREAQRRHEEAMQAHRATHAHLGIGGKQ